MRLYTKEYDIEACIILMKFVRSFYKNLMLTDSTGQVMFNPLTGVMREKDTKFIVSVMDFFNDTTNFTYPQGSIQFSKESSIAKGRAREFGTDMEFIATFDAKTLESQVLKTVSQNIYDDAASMKDRNRMRIEVKSPSDMLKMGLIMGTS